MVEAADIPAGAMVLDVAAGRGATLFPAAEKVGTGGRVIGIDIAPGMVDETNAEIQRRGVANAEMRQMDAERLDFPDETFDVVLCGYAIFMFGFHLVQTMSELRRVLKPGGKIAISTWGRDDDRWKWMGELNQAYSPPNMPPMPQGPNRFGNAEGITALMSEAGFSQIQVVEDNTEVIYASEEEWWAVQWSHGTRFFLEMFPPDALEQYKSEAFQRIQVNRQSDGFHHELPSLFTLARNI